MQEGFAPETVMLCTAYVASTGRSTMAAVVHELKVWRTEGVETGEQADAHSNCWHCARAASSMSAAF